MGKLSIGFVNFLTHSKNFFHALRKKAVPPWRDCLKLRNLNIVVGAVLFV